MNLLESVQQLLEASKIKEALTTAQDALQNQPDDLDSKRAAAAVYYELMKADYDAQNLDGAIDWYSKYYVLQLPEEEAAIHELFKVYQRRIHPEFPRMQEANKLSKAGKNLEALAIYEEVLLTLKDYKVAFVNVGWCLYRLLAEYAPQPNPDVAMVNKCFDLYRKFEILGPSNLHSQMLRIALYFKDVEGVDLLDFLHAWDFKNFRDEDFEPFKTSNNTVIPSLCERAYLSYARVLLGGMKNEKKAATAKQYAEEFLPELESVLEKLPRNVWLPYARALLMSQMGKAKRVQMELIHFLKHRNTEFWAWASLAESYAIVGEQHNALAAFCKAFLLPAPGELAVQVREDFAAHLLKMGFNPEAKVEIETIIDTRQRKEAKISQHILEWQKLPWYEDTRSQRFNKTFYARYAGKADGLLWADLPDSIAVVTHVDDTRGVFFYAVDKKIGGKHNLKGHFQRVRVGDIVALKLKEVEAETGKVWKVVGGTTERENRIPEEIVKRLDETIQIPAGRDFGFMKPSNTYVPPDLVKNFRLRDGDNYRGLALLSFNKGKNEWAWKMIAIEETR